MEGFTPEEIAERCLNRVVSVADTAMPEVQAQAQAFKDRSGRSLFLHERAAKATEPLCITPFDAGQKRRTYQENVIWLLAETLCVLHSSRTAYWLS